jgi:hypothetical protein
MKIAFRVLFCLIAFTTHIAMEQTRLAETDVVPATDAMPEAKYSFAPTAGQIASVRTLVSQ